MTRSRARRATGPNMPHEGLRDARSTLLDPDLDVAGALGALRALLAPRDRRARR